MIKTIFSLVMMLFITSAVAKTTLTFAVVPQQSASKLAQIWTPIIKELAQETEINIKFTTAADIPTFEKRLSEGKYDIAYMNPYHYIVFNQLKGYQAIVKARNKKLKGIMVVAKNSPINSFSELNNTTLAFPAPAAFAATIINQADLKKNNVNFTANYVSSHDSVYLTVAKGIYPAGGGVLRTFNNLDASIQARLRILSTTQGYTPHAIAVHPRVTAQQITKIQQALTSMNNSELGEQLLQLINIKGFEFAKDSDWNDIRQLQLVVDIAG